MPLVFPSSASRDARASVHTGRRYALKRRSEAIAARITSKGDRAASPPESLAAQLEQPLVQLHRRLRLGLERVALGHPTATRFAQATSKRLIVQQPPEGDARRSWIPNLDEQPVAAIGHCLAVRGNVGSRERHPSGHRL